MPDLTSQITQEISRAIVKLGGDPQEVNLADKWQVNYALVLLNADVYLLAVVGSWHTTLSDEEVLADVKAWNEGGPDALRGKSFGG